MSHNLTHKAPNGEAISPFLARRLAEVRPILEQANAERLTRSEAAARVVIGGAPVSDLSVYSYVRLLGISWNHRQDYRKPVCRKRLRSTVPALLRKGLCFYQIAEKVGCSTCTISRFIREEALVEDGKRYKAPLSMVGRNGRKGV